jgi:hypothetical protein
MHVQIYAHCYVACCIWIVRRRWLFICGSLIFFELLLAQGRVRSTTYCNRSRRTDATRTTLCSWRNLAWRPSWTWYSWLQMRSQFSLKLCLSWTVNESGFYIQNLFFLYYVCGVLYGKRCLL